MKILAISDTVERKLYNLTCKEAFSDIDLILSCGDLPFYYLEFLVSTLNIPLYYVFGNHHTGKMLTAHGEDMEIPGGCINIDNKIVDVNGVLIAGFEGCMKYNYGPKQYSEAQMRWKILKITPLLWKNKFLKKRYVDIVITHAPAQGIHDQPDICHRGFRSFLRLIDTYTPRYFIHGHIHNYSLQQTWKTVYHDTTVINAYGYRVIDLP